MVDMCLRRQEFQAKLRNPSEVDYETRCLDKMSRCSLEISLSLRLTPSHEKVSSFLLDSWRFASAMVGLGPQTCEDHNAVWAGRGHNRVASGGRNVWWRSKRSRADSERRETHDRPGKSIRALYRRNSRSCAVEFLGDFLDIEDELENLGAMDDVPNSQDIVDLMFNFNEDSHQVVNEQTVGADSTTPAASYYPTDVVQQTGDDLERDLHTFAEDFLLGPAVQQQYQDIKPVVNPHELFLSQINSTVVNQSLKNCPGELGFKVTFDQHEKVTKNMTWTYSNEVGRLYVMLNSQCPFKVSTTLPPPENSYIVCIPAYKDAVSRRENVIRCPHHCRNQDMNGLSGKFWMNSTHSQSIYYEDIQNNRRHCLIVPYEKPHAGCSTYTYILEFMCRNTCVGGVNRRATEVIFLLQHEGRELGRSVVEVKVCACPGRDRRHDETALVKRLSMESVKNKDQHSGSGGHAKSFKSSHETTLNLSTVEEHDAASEDQWYTIRVKGKSNFEILKRVAEGLELRSAQKLKKRKLTDTRNQNQPTDVKRELDIVYSDG